MFRHFLDENVILHILRPDKCNGAFYENCDSSREYSGQQIVETLQNAGQSDLLKIMNTYWHVRLLESIEVNSLSRNRLSNDESPEDFWSHEVYICKLSSSQLDLISSCARS